MAPQTLVFVPQCEASSSSFLSPVPFTSGSAELSIAPEASFDIYFRPGGDVTEGHGQPGDLQDVAGAVSEGLPDYPPGWFVTIKMAWLQMWRRVRASGQVHVQAADVLDCAIWQVAQWPYCRTPARQSGHPFLDFRVPQAKLARVVVCSSAGSPRFILVDMRHRPPLRAESKKSRRPAASLPHRRSPASLKGGHSPQHAQNQ